MSLSIQVSLRELARVESISVHGRPGCGNYPLYVSMKIRAGNLDHQMRLSQLQCRIELAEPTRPIASGVIENETVKEWNQYSDSELLGFNFYLSASQIAEIEKQRAGGSFRLGVWLSGFVEYAEDAKAFTSHDTFTIQQQQWIDALSFMGYKDSLLFEIPLPMGIEDKSPLKSLIDKAQKHVLNGHYDEAVSQCRHIFEWIESYKDDKAVTRAAVKQYKDQRSDMTIDQRMLFIREAVKNITHIANHFNESEGFSRSQALTILGLTVALLSAPELGIA